MTETEENNSQNIIMGERQLLIVTQAIQITRNSPLMLKAKNKKGKTEDVLHLILTQARILLYLFRSSLNLSHEISEANSTFSSLQKEVILSYLFYCLIFA